MGAADGPVGRARALAKAEPSAVSEAYRNVALAEVVERSDETAFELFRVRRRHQEAAAHEHEIAQEALRRTCTAQRATRRGWRTR
jgi:hypothetical protein